MFDVLLFECPDLHSPFALQINTTAHKEGDLL